MISGGPGAKNLAERVDGVRESLKGSKWVEVAGSPTFCNDDSALAVQQMADLRTATPDLGAIVPIGGWPMFAPEGYKAFVNKNKKDIDAGKFTLVVADTPFRRALDHEAAAGREVARRLRLHSRGRAVEHEPVTDEKAPEFDPGQFAQARPI